MKINIDKAFWQKLRNRIQLLTIAGLLIILFFTRECGCGSSGGDCDPVEIERVDTVTVEKIVEVEVVRDSLVPGKIIYRDRVIYLPGDSIPYPLDVDTAAILEQYFAKLIYNDSVISKDSSMQVYIHDVISQNSIMNRRVLMRNIYKENFITETPKKRNKVFIGPSIGGWTDKFSLGASVMLQTKKENCYALTGDAINRSLMATYYWKIRFRRKNK